MNGMSVVTLVWFVRPKILSRIFGTSWARINSWFTPMMVSVRGRQHIDPGQSYVIVCNHQSQYDIFVLYGWLGIDFKWIMKQELRNIPVIGVACEKLGHIYVDRSNREAALAAMSLLAKHRKVSILTTGVLTPKYHAMVAENYDKFKYCFRIHGEAKQLVGEMFANFGALKKKHGFNNLFIIAQDVSHARGAAKVMKKVAEKKGWNVTGVEIYPTGATDFSIGLLKAKRTKSEIINIWMDMPESAILLKQWYEMKIPALPFGSTLAAAEQPGFWDATEGKGEYTLCNVVNAGNAPSDATPWTMKFYNAYEKRWDVAPEGLGGSSSYMAIYVLRDAIERAGSLDSDKIVAELEKTDVMGVYGRLKFDPKSHQVVPALDHETGAVGSILQWQAGKRVVVYPKSIAKGEIQLPPWMKP